MCRSWCMAVRSPGVNLHTRYSFATIADTVCKALDVDYCAAGCGVYDEICK